MNQIVTPFIYQIGTGVASGFLVGYVIKKILKILMIVLGVSFIAVSYLGLSEIININYEKLASATSGFLLTTMVGLPFASTFLAGFGLGILKG
ncbi:MAG: FUN14 domain-containing protein [Candidatus Bathyarchaeota archaeon]|nr:MAG: FUN14 domain-containing protein [Candidatus Bathyarchaeota archaeon]